MKFISVRLLCAIAALLLVGAAPPLPIPAAGPGDRALLARSAAASGEPWRFHVASRSLASAGGRLSETRIDAEGDRTLTRRCTGVVCVGIYADGPASAAFSYNETPIPQAAPADSLSIVLRAIVSYAFASPAFEAVGGRTLDLGARDLDGSAMRAIAVVVAGSGRLDALIDPATALVRAVTREDGTIVARYGDERKVGPLTLPFRVESEDDFVTEFESRTIEPAPLVPPSGPPTTFAAAPLVLGLMPGTSLPRFPCRVETIAATCLLDTGTSGLAIGLQLADRLHKTPVGQIVLQGLGSVLTGVIRVDSTDLGGMRLGSALYAILPDTTGLRADVVIGADVLGRCVARLDVARGRIEFAPIGTALRGEPLAVAFDEFTPRVPIRLGPLRTEIAIDTGDEASIDLPIALYRRFPGLFAVTQQRAVAGIGGRGTQSIGRIDNVQLGPFGLRNVPIGATDAGFPTRARLGAAFFSRFAIEFDYRNSRIGLERAR